MDQMVSGSGFLPLRLLDEAWLLPQEQTMVRRLEQMLSGTGRGRDLAWDILSLIVYNIDVSVVLDDSGSMQLDMFGKPVGGYGGGYGGAYGGAGSVGGYDGGSSLTLAMRQVSSSAESSWCDQVGFEDPMAMRQLMANRRGSLSSAMPTVAPSPLSPTHRRWYFARDALRRWWHVFQVLGIDPPLYLLNGPCTRCSQLEHVFARQPSGTTPMTQALQAAVGNSASSQGRSALVLVITDGEADDMYGFNALLDSCQNGQFGDMQICLLGLSLVPQDIEWFENEECDETRIRTVEAYEVEARQIRLREVVRKEGGYNFEMHSYRSLVTNLFPADYDYEAPLQNLRHRLYITAHGRDRWWGLNSMLWRWCCSNGICVCCFIGTGYHCCGWCQGNECGKCQKPELLEGCCGGEE